MSDSLGNRKELPEDPTPGVLSSGGGWISGPSVGAPTQPSEERPAVVVAVEALRTFGGDMTREEAAQLLPYWARWSELTIPQVGVVLRRFAPGPQPEPRDPEGLE